jgi:hypothetical protein
MVTAHAAARPLARRHRNRQPALDKAQFLQPGQVRGEMSLADQRGIGDFIERVRATITPSKIMTASVACQFSKTWARMG